MQQGRQDTSRAISNLFERRRKGGRRWTYVAGAGVLAFVRVLVSANNTTVSGAVVTNKVDGGEVATVLGLFVGLPAAIGIGKLVRFNEAPETTITNNYAAGKGLPRAIGRRLRRKDF